MGLNYTGVLRGRRQKREGHVKIEAETRARQPQAKEEGEEFSLPFKIPLAGLRIKLTGDRLTGENEIE